MRKEPFVVGDFVHLIRRGGRGLSIVREESDSWRFLDTLYYLNDQNSGLNALRDLQLSRKAQIGKPHFSWPKTWSERRPLFKLSAFVLVGNHYHLIGLETQAGGISKFMHKSGISMTKYHNIRYQEKGSLFQGSYKARRIDSDEYLRWAVPYVMIKNTFEMHPKGYKWAIANFELAWAWATEYPFSSLGDYAGGRNSPIVDTTELKKIIGTGKEFKTLCRDMILGRKTDLEDSLARGMLLED